MLINATAAAAKSLQLSPTLCDPIDGSPQAPLSLGFSRQEYWSGLPCPSPMHACMLSRFSCVRLCVTPWTAAHQAPLSTAFSSQEYWSGFLFLHHSIIGEHKCTLIWSGTWNYSTIVCCYDYS